tara:strand:+ start:121 stop:432 length:312 start_codon:yes stop_codon:yes gene_type:complete
LKSLFTILITFLFIAAFAVATTSDKKNMEVIIKTTKKINPLTEKKIIKEFYRLEDVIYAERISLTSSFMVIFDNDRVYNSDIHNIFLKWGGNSDVDISYRLIN